MFRENVHLRRVRDRRGGLMARCGPVPAYFSAAGKTVAVGSTLAAATASRWLSAEPSA
jgi:hypothetical protein